MKLKLDKYDIGIIIMLLAFFTIAITAMAGNSITNDEIAHIPAGYSYIKTGDYRMNVEHPPLIKMISGVFLLPLNPKLPLEHPSWAARNEWIFGDRFFFLANSNSDQILFWARFPIVLIGMLLIFFAYKWARELYGPWAGLAAGFFVGLDPLVTTMSTLVHTDIGITTFGFIATYYFWRFCQHRTWKNLSWSMVFLGLGLASKFTGLYFLLIFGLLALAVAWKDSSQPKTEADTPKSKENQIEKSGDIVAGFIQERLFSKKAINLYLLTVMIFLGGLLILAASYYFTGIGAFYDGMTNVAAHSTTGHRSFLHGAFSETGFWDYFPIAFLIKTPLATILLIVLGILTFAWTRSSRKIDEWFLLLPAAVYFLLFVINRINIGVRHILPVYPFLIVFASQSVRSKSKAVKILIGLLAVWLAWNAFMIYPHHLSFFNEAIGGPEHGYEWLIDSNSDWGQDLKGLGAWLSARGEPKLLLDYFGNDDREYRNITWDELKCGPQPGLIAISTNRLIGFEEKDAKCTAWLRTKKQIDRVGYSIRIFNITPEEIFPEQQAYCDEKCKEKCAAEKQIYMTSNFTTKCSCTCAGSKKEK